LYNIYIKIHNSFTGKYFSGLLKCLQKKVVELDLHANIFASNEPNLYCNLELLRFMKIIFYLMEYGVAVFLLQLQFLLGWDPKRINKLWEKRKPFHHREFLLKSTFPKELMN
jgi:hypothetical protein